jgi:hypothetical protein
VVVVIVSVHSCLLGAVDRRAHAGNLTSVTYSSPAGALTT